MPGFICILLRLQTSEGMSTASLSCVLPPCGVVHTDSLDFLFKFEIEQNRILCKCLQPSKNNQIVSKHFPEIDFKLRHWPGVHSFSFRLIPRLIFCIGSGITRRDTGHMIQEYSLITSPRNFKNISDMYPVPLVPIVLFIKSRPKVRLMQTRSRLFYLFTLFKVEYVCYVSVFNLVSV